MYVAAENCLLDSVPAIPPNLRIHVFAGMDDLVSIKQVATTSEVKVWIDEQRNEQPAITTVCLTQNRATRRVTSSPDIKWQVTNGLASELC
jgi:hypothetical protein